MKTRIARRTTALIAVAAWICGAAACAQSSSAERTAETKSQATATTEAQNPEMATPDVLLRALRIRNAREKAAGPPEEQPPVPFAQFTDTQLFQLYTFKCASIYGPDDRRDLCLLDPKIPDDQAILTLSDSVPAVFLASDVIDATPPGTDTAKGVSKLKTGVFQNVYRLCDKERFGTQPVGAQCSATLVGPDLVLTAGHCIGSDRFPKNSVRFVFGYRMLDDDNPQLTVPNEDIYSAKEIVQRAFSPGGADWALVRLDRPVKNRKPIPIARYDAGAANADERGVPAGLQVFAIGFPCGLPAKVTGNALAFTNTVQCCFVANLDTFGGNSGSGVFAFRHNRYELVGILVRGLSDFDFVAVDGCYRALRYTDNQAGESVVCSSEFQRLIPDPG